MELKATTVYDEKILKDFICFSLFRGKRFKTRRVAYAVILPILIAALAFDLILSFLWQISDLRWLIVLMLVLLISFGVLIFFIVPASMGKSSRKLLGTRISYIFRDDQFFMEAENLDLRNQSVIRYAILHRVYETKDYLYIFPNRSFSYILDLHAIGMNNVQALRETISAHLPPKKYVICKE
ncbi:MAG TPA: YcxB family protein [Clostridiales bacterium]|nr:YcxB family protein [Clostridiales bacterium]